MTNSSFIIMVIAFALIVGGGWVWIRRNQNQVKEQLFAKQRAEEENEQLTTERKLSREKAMAEAKAREDARLQTETEELIRKEAEAEVKRRAEEEALAEAQAREVARLQTESEAKERAEVVQRERARIANEERLTEERRQTEERTVAEAEEHKKAQAVKEEQPQADETEEIEENETAVESVPKPPEAEETPRPPVYRPLAPSPTTAPSRPRRPTGSRTAKTSNTDLRLRVQLVFGRGGVVRSLMLVPDRRDGMPSEIEVVGTQGKLHLSEWSENCYEPVTLSDAGNALTQGIEWHGCDDAQQWRWILGGRELFVLAPGDEFGLHGFVSVARLWLNARHVVLATERLREEIPEALVQAGCATLDVSDGTTSDVPDGWYLFRDVTPTRAVPMRDERDILNALCPSHEIEPHFVGGIRLERNIWLAGYPPRIRFTGELAEGFDVKIDNHPAQPASDGAFEASGWDSEGEHRLWFGDRSKTYSLRTMGEAWEQWHAHDLGTGSAICGATICQLDGQQCTQVRIPVSNPLLVGAQPGEIFRCQIRNDLRSKAVIALVPFTPVWALPLDPIHADKRVARILPLNLLEAVMTVEQPTRRFQLNNTIHKWVTAINDAGRKQLTLSDESDSARDLWYRYRTIAKQLWKQGRKRR
jgi:hypothetical protein